MGQDYPLETPLKAAKRLLAAALGAALLVAAVLVLRPPASGDILLSRASAAPMADRPGAVAVFVTIENTGPPDRIIGASSSEAATVDILAPGDGLPIPAGSRPSLAADGAFLRLGGVAGALDPGRLIPVSLDFERAGPVTMRTRIVDPVATGRAGAFGLLGIGDICVAGENGEPAPAIRLEVQPDGDGWTVQVLAEEFAFSRDLVDGPHVPGTGHGHLYVGGLKLERLYAPVARIGALPPGRHELRVTLNSNDHRAYVVDDVPVTASAVIEVD